jgi:hypothetical protein
MTNPYKKIADAFRDIREWMLARADDYEVGVCQQLQSTKNGIVDVSLEEAVSIRERARALDASIAAIENLNR